MKRHLLVTVLMAVFAITSISAQDLQEILDNHFETIGQEKLLEIKSIHAEDYFEGRRCK